MANKLEFASAAATGTDAGGLAGDVIARIRSRFGGEGGPDEAVDLVFVFVSPHFAEDVAAIRDAIQDGLRPRVLAGCVGEGVIGADREIEQTPAVSVIAARLPGIELTQRPIRAADLHQMLGRGALPPKMGFSGGDSLYVMLADPFSTDMDRLLGAFNASLPGVPIIGGMASGSRSPAGTVLFTSEGIQRDGAVAVGFAGDITVDIIVSQGCRPVGPPLEIREARDNLILTLDDHPPLVQLETIVGELEEEERGLLRNGLFIGRAIDPNKEILGRGDFLVRGVMGVDPRNGSITIGDFVNEGDVVQFHLRDAATAEEDLELMLTPHGLFGPPEGALLFSCNGRGTRLYDHPNGDVSVIQRFFPGLNLAGFFCAGEIGPVGGKNFLHGHTASLVLFRPPVPERIPPEEL